MQVDYNDIIYILGNTQSCFVFQLNEIVVELNCSLHCLSEKLEPEGFIQANNFTLINTRFVVNSKSKRFISLKGGSMHKVSRKFRKYLM